MQPANSPYEDDGVTLKKQEQTLTPAQKSEKEFNDTHKDQVENEELANKSAVEGDWESYNDHMRSANRKELDNLQKTTGQRPSSEAMPATQSPVPKPREIVVPPDPSIKPSFPAPSL